MITFTKVKLPHGWLSSMSAFPITFNGKEWRTNEHLFQALRFNDETIMEEIRLCRSPMSAKFFAKKNADKMVVEPKSKADLDNMKMVLRLKIDQHPEIKKALLETGNEMIVEDVTKRGIKGNNLFWGMAHVDGDWIGENILGNIWAELRQEMKMRWYSCPQCGKPIESPS